MAFETKEDALRYFFNGNTNYEKEKGLTNITRRVILDTEDMAIAERKSEDGEITIAYIIKLSTKKNSWVFWVMSKNQVEVFHLITPLIIDYMIMHTQIYGKARF